MVAILKYTKKHFHNFYFALIPLLELVSSFKHYMFSFLPVHKKNFFCPVAKNILQYLLIALCLYPFHRHSITRNIKLISNPANSSIIAEATWSKVALEYSGRDSHVGSFGRVCSAVKFNIPV